MNVPPLDESQFAQALAERSCKVGESGCSLTIEESDHGHRRLLSARRKRPRGRATEQGDEFTPVAHHAITSSASARSVGGTSMLMVLAVLRLMTISILVGNSTGM
jgi:hypothetical protein